VWTKVNMRSISLEFKKVSKVLESYAFWSHGEANTNSAEIQLSSFSADPAG
jgi:hypothetical protein